MKKGVLFVLVGILMLSTMLPAFAAISCTAWQDTGKVTNKTCIGGWCGINPWGMHLVGTKEQSRACSGFDASGKYVAYQEIRNVEDHGACC